MDSDVSLAVAWYRENQWERLRSLASDRDNLAATHAEWRATAERMSRQLAAMGRESHPIEVDVEMLWAWCCANGRKLDGPARAEFVARRARELAAEGGGE